MTLDEAKKASAKLKKDIEVLTTIPVAPPQQTKQKVQYVRHRVPPHPLEVWESAFKSKLDLKESPETSAQIADECMALYIERRDNYIRPDKH